MLEVGFRVSDIAGAAQPEGPRALRQGPFYSGTEGVLGRKGRCACALACGQQGELLVVRAERQHSRARPRAPGMAGTRPAICCRKADLDDVVAVLIVGWRPLPTGAPFRTDGLLGLPIKNKPTASEATGLKCLPVGVGGRRPQQIHAVVALTGDEQLRVHIARIDHVLRWYEPFALQGVVNRLGHGDIRCGGRCGFHLRHEMGRVWLAGLGQMHLVADPGRAALLALAGVGVVGGVELLRRGGQLVAGAPAGDARAEALLLGPDLAQRLHRRHLRQPARVGV
jgi:hypothetical protein